MSERLILPFIRVWPSCRKTMPTIEIDRISVVPRTGDSNSSRPMMSLLIRIMRRKIHTVPQAFISPRNLANMRGTILLTLWDRGLFLRPVAREFHATGLHLGHIGLQHLGAGQALGDRKSTRLNSSH